MREFRKAWLLLAAGGLIAAVGGCQKYESHEGQPAKADVGVIENAIKADQAKWNEEFTKELGRMLNRPTVARVPALAIRTALGGLSKELLSSVRVEPARLEAAGFEFEQPTLNERLASALTP